MRLIGSEILTPPPTRSSAQTQGQQVTILENSSVLVQLEAIVDRKLEKNTIAVLFGETLFEVQGQESDPIMSQYVEYSHSRAAGYLKIG